MYIAVLVSPFRGNKRVAFFPALYLLFELQGSGLNIKYARGAWYCKTS